MAPDRQQWIELRVRELAQPAFKFAMVLVRDPSLAEEIVQEAFMRAWQSGKTPHEAGPFKNWLYRIILNLVRSRQRRERSQARLVLELPTQSWQATSLDPDLAQALQSLSPREREAVYLRFFEDASYEDAAQVMGTRPATVRVLVHRALAKLRRSLEDCSFVLESGVV